MKEIDKEKFQRTVERARVRFGLAYYGKSNNMTLVCKWNEKETDPTKLTDEELVLLWQLVNSALNTLTREQIKRDLVSDDIKKLYEDADALKKAESQGLEN